MKNWNSSQLSWALLIVLMLSPLLLVHLASDEVLPRLSSLLLIFAVLPSILLIVSLNPNEKPISATPRLRRRYSARGLKRWDVAARLLGMALSLSIYYYAYPAWQGSYKFLVEGQPLSIIEGTITNQRSTLFGQTFLIRSFDLKEGGEHYQFWYPNMVSTEGRYRFTMLTGTRFVLDSGKIE